MKKYLRVVCWYVYIIDGNYELFVFRFKRFYEKNVNKQLPD